MNKNAIKKFAIAARRRLIDSVTDRAGMIGITAEGISEPVTKGAGFEVYKTSAGTEITLTLEQCDQRRQLKSRLNPVASELWLKKWPIHGLTESVLFDLWKSMIIFRTEFVYFPLKKTAKWSQIL